jgi:hypothetical protein
MDRVFFDRRSAAKLGLPRPQPVRIWCSIKLESDIARHASPIQTVNENRFTPLVILP